jgi:hypothetical protein
VCFFAFYHRTRGYRAHRAPGIPCALSAKGVVTAAPARDDDFVAQNE